MGALGLAAYFGGDAGNTTMPDHLTSPSLTTPMLRQIAMEPGRACPAPGEVHIVDQMIAERSRGLRSHPLWPLMRPFLWKILHYREAVELADTVATMSAEELFAHAAGQLSLDVRARGVEHIPSEGGFMVVCNHPTGIADGLAMYEMLKARRPDMVFMANRDALRVNIRLADMIVPVEWREGAKSAAKAKETLKLTARAIEREVALVIFPSGRLATWREGALTERPWMPSAVALAKKHDLPIVPMNMAARNSGLFYLVSRFSQELRDMTVFHELLNKKGARFDLTVGAPIDPATLGDTARETERLQAYCTGALARDPKAVFEPMAHEPAPRLAGAPSNDA